MPTFRYLSQATRCACTFQFSYDSPSRGWDPHDLPVNKDIPSGVHDLKKLGRMKRLITTCLILVASSKIPVNGDMIPVVNCDPALVTRY